MEWSAEASARQRQMEREIVCLKDTIWRLTSRIYMVETFVKHKYGATALSSTIPNLSFNEESVKVIPIMIHGHKEELQKSSSQLEGQDMGNDVEQEQDVHTIVEDESMEDSGQIVQEHEIITQEETEQEEEESSSNVPDVIRIYKPDLKTFVTVKAEVLESNSQNPEANIECHICHKKFSHQENLQRHILIHRATQYKCDECGRGFSHQGNLKTHKLRHQRVKQRQAEVEMRQQLLLNQPQTDLENRKHPCSYCEKRFYTAQQRNIHTRIHTGEKPFECNLCEKKFNQKASLVDHALGHVGEKNNFCHLCPASFVRSRNLLKHIRQVHKMAQIKTVLNGERIVEFVPEDEAASIIESRKDNVETKKPTKLKSKKSKSIHGSSSSSPAVESNVKQPRRTARANAGRNSKYESKDDYADVATEEYA